MATVGGLLGGGWPRFGGLATIGHDCVPSEKRSGYGWLAPVVHTWHAWHTKMTSKPYRACLTALVSNKVRCVTWSLGATLMSVPSVDNVCMSMSIYLYLLRFCLSTPPGTLRRSGHTRGVVGHGFGEVLR